MVLCSTLRTMGNSSSFPFISAKKSISVLYFLVLDKLSDSGGTLIEYSNGLNVQHMNTMKLLAFGLMMFSGCSEPSKKSEEKVMNEPVKVGADKDDHGCLASAGYAWSEIKKDCVQLFNDGLRLNPVKIEKGKVVVSAFILMSDDQSKVELFLPNDTRHSILLIKVGGLIYEGKTYRYDANKSILYNDGEVLYNGDIE